jgi:dynein intermediate chain
MADRVKKELEEKRAKLVELRRARDERKALLAQAEKGTSEVYPSRLPYVNQKRELMIAKVNMPRQRPGSELERGRHRLVRYQVHRPEGPVG